MVLHTGMSSIAIVQALIQIYAMPYITIGDISIANLFYEEVGFVACKDARMVEQTEGAEDKRSQTITRNRSSRGWT